jgi:two-component sensor histidine kinase
VLAVLTLGFFDVDRLGGNFGSWFVVFLAGFIVTVVSIEVGKRFVSNSLNQTWRAIQIGFLLLIAGLIRGATIFLTGQANGLIPEDDLVFRLVGGPIFVFSSYLVSNAILASFANFREESALLFAERERLARSQNSYASDLELVTQQQRNRVSDLLLPAMWELQKKLETATDPTKLQDALLSMQSLNNEIVRPLSKELSEKIGTPLLEAVEEDLPAPSQPKLAERVRLSEVQPPWLYFGISILIGLNSQIAFTSVRDGLVIVGTALIPPVTMFFLERITIGRKLLPVATALFVSGMLGGIAGFIGGILVSYTGLAISSIFIWQSTLLVFLLKATNTVFGMYLKGWKGSVEQLKEVTAVQRVVNSRLRQQVWLGQKALAMELHGSVQATLQALAMRLGRMQDPQPEELEQILTAVRQSLHRIENQDYLAGQDLHSLLEELKELWEGTADVRWNESTEVLNLLELDPGLARCTFEVIRESVTNAVKHGNATEIDIEMQVAEQTLSVRVSNNGKLANKGKESVGATLLDQLCLTRELSVEGDKTIFKAELAINPQIWKVPALS